MKKKKREGEKKHQTCTNGPQPGSEKHLTVQWIATCAAKTGGCCHSDARELEENQLCRKTLGALQCHQFVCLTIPCAQLAYKRPYSHICATFLLSEVVIVYIIPLSLMTEGTDELRI